MASGKRMREAINEAFDYYEGLGYGLNGLQGVAGVHKPRFLGKVLSLCDAHEDDLNTVLSTMRDQGMVIIAKGPRGGVCRLMTVEEQNEVLKAIIQNAWGPSPIQTFNQAVTDYTGNPTFMGAARPSHTASPDPIPGQAINNHTCACGNTRCNKSEKTCWRCGNPL